MQTKTFAATATLILLSLTVIVLVDALMHYSFSVPNRARIKGVGVSIWWDQTTTQPVEFIDWGMLEPNETKTTPLYFQSKSNVNITLTLATANWNPPQAETYVTLTWNYTSATLTPKTVTPIELSLHISALITDIDSFQFDIIITATG